MFLTEADAKAKFQIGHTPFREACFNYSFEFFPLVSNPNQKMGLFAKQVQLQYSSQGLFIHALADAQSTSVPQNELDAGVRRSWFVADQGEARPIPVDALPAQCPFLPTHLELPLPPVELTFL